VRSNATGRLASEVVPERDVDVAVMHHFVGPEASRPVGAASPSWREPTMEHASIEDRLANERNVWLATHRADHPPHLVPVWFVWLDERFWICCSTSQKSRNIDADDRVTVALEDGNAPVVAEGSAVLRERPYPDEVRAAFGEKYQWDIDRPDEDGAYDVLIELPVSRWVFGAP
jgi:hypothetical protein